MGVSLKGGGGGWGGDVKYRLYNLYIAIFQNENEAFSTKGRLALRYESVYTCVCVGGEADVEFVCNSLVFLFFVGLEKREMNVKLET